MGKLYLDNSNTQHVPESLNFDDVTTQDSDLLSEYTGKSSA